MGEVYRARDPKLDRHVAIKVLPTQLAENGAALARFEREAKAVAALSHPNILSIFDFGRDGTTVFAVMELLDGETLRQQLAMPMPTRKAVDYAVQIARGLAAAHARGIVHRDLKPENVFVTTDGRVKILDFGLARQTLAFAEADATVSPTIERHTDPGTVLGTVGYMSPEQARGEPGDPRSDLFSLGTVLYELVSGRRAFQRDTAAETLTAILREDPPELTAGSASGVPPALTRVVQHCLEKNPAERFQSASDVAFALENLSGASSAALQSVTSSPRHRRGWLPWVIAGGSVIAALTWGLLQQIRTTRGDSVAVSFAVTPPKNAAIGYGALSPDGRRLIVRVIEPGGQRRLWIRPLDSLTMQPLPSTEGGERPFWSPDGRFVGFFTGQLIKKLDLATGAVQIITSVGLGTANGATFTPGGDVIYSANLRGLYRVAADGGPPRPLTTLDAAHHETRHYFPTMLPDGDHLLYVVTSTDADVRGLWVTSLADPHAKRRLLADLTQGAYAQGYLFFARNGALMAQPFDVARLALHGEARLVADNVSYSPVIGFSDFSVSEAGVLAYLPTAAPWRLTWFDRSGRSIAAFGAAGAYQQISLSPDGTHVATEGYPKLETSYELFVIDQARGTTTQLTFGAASGNFPVWSPDGSAIAFGSNRAGHYDIYRKTVGTSAEELLLSSDRNKFLMDWSRDGRWLLYGEADPAGTKEGLWIVPAHGDRKPVPYVPADADHRDGRFSPDGHFVAYTSDESSTPQVYVETFPAGGGKWQISTSGGTNPRWRGDGRELYYLSPGAELMAAAITPAPRFAPETPVKLFDTWIRSYLANFDVSPDGQRFLILAPGEDFVPTPMNILINWQTLLNRK